MVIEWILLGQLGWGALMIFRIKTEGRPKGISFASYVRGYLFATILGPLCFAFLGYLIFKRLK